MDKRTALEINYEESRQIQSEWAIEIDIIASKLPPEMGYHRPEHDPNCASCTIGRAIRAIARFHLGPEHWLAHPLPEFRIGQRADSPMINTRITRT